MWRIISPEGIATIAAVAIVSLLYVAIPYLPDISRETYEQIVGWAAKLAALWFLVWLFKSLILAAFFVAETPKKD